MKLKPNVQPVAHASRRVPHAILNKLKKKLDEMTETKIIEKVNECSEWVNHLVTVEKRDEEKSLRCCLDPSELNDSLVDEQTYMCTFEDISSKLSQMKYFSVLDLKDGYWQVKLSEKSKKLCAFATPFGIYRFKRLPFGIKTAPAVFQRLNSENFADIPNVIIYSDDILIFGKTRQEHDQALLRVLERAAQRNVRFNERKMKIAVTSVKYFGHIFTQNEIKPDPERLAAIEQMGTPTNKKDLQTFMGVINYLRPFNPNLSDLTAPLRELLKKDIIFNWTERHTQVFDQIKTQIKNSYVLIPFDPTKEITIQCDASQFGLGCCLLQDNKPISFASRSLTDAEKNYAQIEKEMLSILFACNKFSFYTYGRSVTVINDHKPLLGIMKKEIHKISSAKLQRIRLKLLNFDIKLEYAPGKTIVLADYLSRYMSKSTENNENKLLTESILSINVSDERKIQIQNETANDTELKIIKEYCMMGWPKNKNDCKENVRYMYKLRDDILLDDDILFYKQRVIIPKSMRQMILKKLHEPHFGVTKTIKRAQNSVFWPSICNEIEQEVLRCQICQENSHANQKEPMISHPIPNEPFKKIACDVLEFKANNYLIVVDFYSKWIEMIKLKRKTANEINTELLKIFARFGIPHIIIGDNMPLDSHECKEFAKENDIKIITTSPRYPQSNGMAERAVGICQNILKKSQNEFEIQKALLAYRTTQTKHMSYSPSQLLQNRNLRIDLPMHNSKFEPKLCVDVEKQLERKQNEAKSYYDRDARARQTNFENKQSVIFLNNNKWQHGTIVNKHDTPRSYVIQSDGRNYRRNAKHIKQFHESKNEMSVQNETNNQPNENEQEHRKVTRSGRRY